MCGINDVGLDSFEIAGFVGGQVDPNYSLPSIPRQTQFQGISLDNGPWGAILRAIRTDIIVALSGEGSRQREEPNPTKPKSKAKQTKKTAQPLGAVFLHGHILFQDWKPPSTSKCCSWTKVEGFWKGGGRSKSRSMAWVGVGVGGF